MEKQEFKITWLEADNLSAFESFILEDERIPIRMRRPVCALGLVAEDVAAGALVGRYTDELTFQITSLFVAHAYRRMGGASLLLHRLLIALPEEISVSAEYTTEEDDGLSAFFEAQDFYSYKPDSLLYRVPFSKILAATKPLLRSRIEAAPYLADYDEAHLRLASNIVVKEELPCPPGGLLSNGIDKDLSTLFLANGKLFGYMIVDRFARGNLTLSGFYSTGGAKMFGRMLLGAVVKAHEFCKGTDSVVIPVIDSEAEDLLLHLLPDAELLTVGYARYSVI